MADEIHTTEPPHDYCTTLSPSAHRKAWADFWNVRFRETDKWLNLQKSPCRQTGSKETSIERNPGYESGE